MSRELRIAIIASVVGTTLVVALLQPFTRLVWTLLTRAGSGYVDGIYESAAFGHRNWIDVLTLNLVGSVLLGMMTMGLVLAIFGPGRISRVLAMVIPGRPRGATAQVVTRVVLAAYFFIGIAVLLAFIVQAGIPNQLNASFQQRLAILAPHINDQTGDELVVQWASIRERSDYLAVNRRLQGLAEDFGIDFPDLRVD